MWGNKDRTTRSYKLFLIARCASTHLHFCVRAENPITWQNQILTCHFVFSWSSGPGFQTQNRPPTLFPPHTWVTHNRMSASPPCPLLHGKEMHVQPRREPQDGFQETRRKTSWQNTDRTARAWGRLRKCEGWHKTRKTRYWPLSRGFFLFFLLEKVRPGGCFVFLLQSSLTNSDIIFVKLHAPWEVLGKYAELMNVRMPFR